MGDKKLIEISIGRSLSGSIAGAAAVVLSILGLAKIYPELFVAIATIAIGVSLLLKALAITAEFPRLLSETSGSRVEAGSGISVEFIAGATGIVLGILALLGVEFQPLVSIAVIVFGAGLIFGTTIIKSVNELKAQVSGAESSVQKVMHEIVSATMGTQLLVGIGAVVLGILSLIGFMPLVLTLVALLAIGGATLLTGSAVTGRMFSLIKHH
jgi:hypothetical protein